MLTIDLVLFLTETECPGLADCHGDAFVQLYEKYEKMGKRRQEVDARKLWQAILESQVETGML